MTTTIAEAFELPRPEDIRAMGFVVELRELDPNSNEVERLARDYVVTPPVEKELPRILDDMKQVFDRGEEYGRFIDGSFGSGKSHFMAMLSLLVEGAPAVWKKFRPLLNARRDAKASKVAEAPDQDAWLTKAGLLVVRIHMLSIRGKTFSFRWPEGKDAVSVEQADDLGGISHNLIREEFLRHYDRVRGLE